MADLIDRQVCIDMFQRMAYDDWNQGVNTTWANAFSEAADMIEDLPSVEAEPVVRCRDCKHFPAGTDRDDLEFPDEICPCHCEDFWYSWKPNDDFYCGKGERKDSGNDQVNV